MMLMLLPEVTAMGVVCTPITALLKKLTLLWLGYGNGASPDDSSSSPACWP